MTESLFGKKIRQYRVMEPLGKGGMGEVYVAADEVLGRNVALKVLRSEHKLESGAKARFLREARVLSKLEHPNICRIYDLIEEDDNNYIILELIPGRNLREVSREGVSSSVRTGIVHQIAEVLTVAHGKGIVHRDLKPENIMLTPENTVKLLDFGLAGVVQPGKFEQSVKVRDIQPDEKEISDISEEPTLLVGEASPASSEDKPSSDTSFTRAGTIMGTLSYMSPEQARGEQATTASDIYSFGLVFQELLTSKQPYPENLDPMKKLVMAQKGETLPAEGIDPDTAALITRMKALAPAQRPTAMDILEKLEEIADKPRKKMRRLLLAAAVAVLTILAALMSFQAFRIQKEADRANKEAVRANREAESSKRVSDFLVSIFTVSDPGESRGNTVTAREILDKGSEKISAELKDEPLTSAKLMQTMGQVYYNLGLFSKSRPLLENAAKTFGRELGKESVEYSEVLFSMADLIATEGDLVKSEELYLESLRIKEKKLGADDPSLGLCLANLGWVYYARGEYDRAISVCERAVKVIEGTPGPADKTTLANAVNNLAMAYRAARNYQEAEPLYERTVELVKNSAGTDSPEYAGGLSNYAVLCESMKKYDKAESLYKEALAIQEKVYGEDHVEVATTLNNLARLYSVEKKFVESEKLFLRALGIHGRIFSGDHYESAIIMNNMGALYASMDRFSDAETFYSRALAVFRKELGENHPHVATCRNNYAELLRKAGKGKQADKLLSGAGDGSGKSQDG